MWVVKHRRLKVAKARPGALLFCVLQSVEWQSVCPAVCTSFKTHLFKPLLTLSLCLCLSVCLSFCLSLTDLFFSQHLLHPRFIYLHHQHPLLLYLQHSLLTRSLTVTPITLTPSTSTSLIPAAPTPYAFPDTHCYTPSSHTFSTQSVCLLWHPLLHLQHPLLLYLQHPLFMPFPTPTPTDRLLLLLLLCPFL